MSKFRRNFFVLLSAGVVTIAATAVIITALTREDKPKNNYVDLNELPDSMEQGKNAENHNSDSSGQELADNENQESTGGNRDLASNEGTDADAPGKSEQAQGDTQSGNTQTADGADKSGTQSADNGNSADDSQDTAQVSSSTDKPVTSGTQTKPGGDPGKDSGTDPKQTGSKAQQSGETDSAQSGQTVETVNPNVIAQSLHFDENNELAWPVRGNIVLNYSVDHVIYHPTLNSFRTNPAVLISAAAGTPVLAAIKGVVLEVKDDPVTGLTVTMGIGDGYTLIYGQLADVTAVPGDIIESGAQIGTIAPPTKYYTLEGENLYFQVCSGAETVNPLLYLE